MVANINSPIGPLPIGWKLEQLKDITIKIGSGSTPRGGESVYINSRLNFAFVRSQNVFDYEFSSDQVRFITDEDAHKLKGVHLQKDDILLNITGDGITFARACIVPEDILPAAVNQHVSIIRVDKSQCLPGYLLAYLCLPQVKEYIETFNAGGSRRAVTKGHIETFEVPLAPIEVQEAIQKNVYCLLKKINLNVQINNTLEKMAKALFKSWFVDFDPVIDNALDTGASISDFPEAIRSKAKQRKQAQQQTINSEKLNKRLPENIRSLFPNEFEQMDESNIGIEGWIPKGWRLDAFSNIASLKTTSVHPNREPDKIWKQFSLPAFDSGKVPSQDIGIEIKSGKYKVSNNVVLVSKLNPHNPRVWLPKVIDIEASVCSTEFMPFEPLIKEQRVFVYSLMCSDVVQSEITSRVTGTTGSHQRVSPKNIAVLPVIIPTPSSLNLYCEMVKELFNKIDLNIEQNIKLIALRNTLLPKLISGEVQLGK
jgi:type I restriction enzyme S subunit